MDEQQVSRILGRNQLILDRRVNFPKTFKRIVSPYGWAAHKRVIGHARIRVIMNSRVLTTLILVACGAWLSASPRNCCASISTCDGLGVNARGGLSPCIEDQFDPASADLSAESSRPAGSEAPADQAFEEISHIANGFGTSAPPSSGSQLRQTALGSFSLCLCTPSARRTLDELCLVFPPPHPTGIMRPPCGSSRVMVG